MIGSYTGREGVGLPDKSPPGLYPLCGREAGTECEIARVYLERPVREWGTAEGSPADPPSYPGGGLPQTLREAQTQHRGENALPQLPKIPRANGKPVRPKPRGVSGSLYDLTHPSIEPPAESQI